MLIWKYFHDIPSTFHLGSLLFVLAHYQALLETITRAPNYVFPSFANNTHIIGFMSEISCAFDHLSTQLAQVGFKIKVSKCKFWSLSRISLSTEIPYGCTLVINGLRILGVPVGSQDFAMHFWLRFYFKMWRILMNFPLLGDAHVALGILSSCVTHRPSYLTWIIFLSSHLLFLLASFNKRVMQVCGDIMGLRLWEFFQNPLARRQAWLPISFGDIGFLSMKDYAPFVLIGSWALVAPYLCHRFHIFNRFVLEEYVSQIEKGPHLLQSCLRAVWNGLPLVAKEMLLLLKI